MRLLNQTGQVRSIAFLLSRMSIPVAAPPSLGPISTRPISTVRLNANDMRRRRASRILVMNPENQVLLFEYSHAGQGDALADKGAYYTVPGGGAKDGESFEQCASRELQEETGITNKIPSKIVAVRQAPLLIASGEIVLADERYFSIQVDRMQALDTSMWTVREKQNIKRAFWCTPADLVQFEGRNLWPSTLREILEAAQRPGNPPPTEYKSKTEKIGSTIVEVSYS